MNPRTMVNNTKTIEVIFSREGRSTIQNGKVDKKIIKRIHGTPIIIESTDILNTQISLILGSILWIAVVFCS